MKPLRSRVARLEEGAAHRASALLWVEVGETPEQALVQRSRDRAADSVTFVRWARTEEEAVPDPSVEGLR